MVSGFIASDLGYGEKDEGLCLMWNFYMKICVYTPIYKPICICECKRIESKREGLRFGVWEINCLMEESFISFFFFSWIGKQSQCFCFYVIWRVCLLLVKGERQRKSKVFGVMFFGLFYEVGNLMGRVSHLLGGFSLLFSDSRLIKTSKFLECEMGYELHIHNYSLL